MNKFGGTSYPEQVICACVSNFFPDALNRYKCNGIEADIFIPSIKCVIEIDGGFWHDDKVANDNSKNKHFNDMGLFVIHIRELTLENLDPFVGRIIWTKLSNDNELFTSVILLFNELSKFVKDKKIRETLRSGTFCLNSDNIRFTALSKLYKNIVHPNVLDYAGGQLWDYEKNIGLNPLTINLENCGSKKFFFRCIEKNPRRKRLTTCLLPLKRWCVDYNTIDPNDKEALLMFEWKKNHCSIIHFCHRKDCQAMKDLFKFMLENYIPVRQGTVFTDRISWQFLCNFKDVVKTINSENCPETFIRSVKAIVYNRLEAIPRGWIKTDAQQKEFDSAIKKINDISLY